MPIFSLGHSTTDKDKLIELLKYPPIDILLDCRSHPKSQFIWYWRSYKDKNGEELGLEGWIPPLGIEYRHFWRLGGYEPRHLEYQAQIPQVDISLYTGRSFPREKLHAPLDGRKLFKVTIKTKDATYKGTYFGRSRKYSKALKKSTKFIIIEDEDGSNFRIPLDDIVEFEREEEILKVEAERDRDPITKMMKVKAGHDIQWYMTLPPFFEGIQIMLDLAKTKNVAFMCTEPEWWRCHRGQIADHLWYKGIDCTHLRQSKKNEPMKTWKHSENIANRLDLYYPEVKDAWDRVKYNV